MEWYNGTSTRLFINCFISNQLLLVLGDSFLDSVTSLSGGHSLRKLGH